MNPLEAFGGGLHNFFSIWILCLLQVIPFLLAFFLGVYLKTEEFSRERSGTNSVGFSCAGSLLGFGLIYGALASSSPLASLLFHYQALLLQLGGVLLLLYASYFLGLLKATKPWRPWGGLLVGAILALAYQPCITPTLSTILNLLKNPTHFSQGIPLLIFYTLGLVFAIGMTGSVLLYTFSREKVRGMRSIALKGCGLLMTTISLLIIFRKMTLYKSFLVGWWS